MIKPCVTQLIMGTANVFYKMLFYFHQKKEPNSSRRTFVVSIGKVKLWAGPNEFANMFYNVSGEQTTNWTTVVALFVFLLFRFVIQQ